MISGRLCHLFDILYSNDVQQTCFVFFWVGFFFLVIGRPVKEIYFAFWKIKGNENEKQIPLVALSKNLKTKKEKLIQKKNLISFSKMVGK